jgi:hypothetical protein
LTTDENSAVLSLYVMVAISGRAWPLAAVGKEEGDPEEEAWSRENRGKE